MTSSRRLLYQAMLVAALAGFSAIRARPAAAAREAATTCTSMGCTDDCGSVWSSIICIDCGGDAYPVCQPDIWNCGPGQYSYGCAFAS